MHILYFSQYFPPEVRWTRPHGGLFLWVTLPQTLDSHKILEAAVAQKVAFVPGNSFYANPVGPVDHHMRLNFSNASPELIQEGIRRLALAVESQLLMTYA